MSQTQRHSMPPTPVPELLLRDSGKRITIDGKVYRILEMYRSNTCTINYNVKPKPKALKQYGRA